MPRQASNQTPRIRRTLHALQIVLQILRQSRIAGGAGVEQALYRLYSQLESNS